MKTIKINIKQVCKLVIFDHLEDDRYYYHEKRHFWNKKSGFYKESFLGSDTWVDKEYIEATAILYIESYKVYYKPHVDIYLSNGHVITNWHESVHSLYKFIDEYFKDIPLIII
jgi:hypothetical protein